MEMKYLGTFRQQSLEMRASDPCYDRDVWCQHLIENVQPGKWDAWLLVSDEGSWGMRNAELLVKFHNADEAKLHELVALECGVDSGQFGFFDDRTYLDCNALAGKRQDDADVPPDETSRAIWYKVCCMLTMSEERAGLLPNGVVCRSGFGDGCYDVIPYADEQGKVKMLRAVFIESENESSDL